EIPDYRYFGMMALNGVADLSVCIGFQITIFDAVLQEIREFRFTCHLREIFGRKYSSPSPGSYQVNIAVVNHLFRQALPECEVNEVSGYVHNTLALLFGIKRPGGANERITGNILEKVMYRLFGDSRVFGSS